MERVKDGNDDEQDGKPRNSDFAFLAAVRPRQLFNTRRQQDEERSQHHHAQHFGNNCCVFCIRADGMTCRHHLRHFVHSRTNVDTESFRTKPLRHQRIYRRVEENRDGPEDNNGCNSHGYFTGFCFHYRLSRQYRGSTTDTATGTDQPAGVLIQTKHFLPQEASQQEGTGQRQHVNDDPTDTDIGNLRERQTEAIKNDTQT